jgi:bifunctional non-homologous end joining protein LigD
LKLDLPSQGDAVVDLGGRTLRLSNLHRVLWPRTGFTKGDLVAYYADISSMLLPHIAGRPLTLKRAPKGVDDWYWFQTSCPHPPEWVSTQRIKAASSGKTFDYCVVDDLPSLLWVVNLAAIELHPLLSWSGGDQEAEVVVFDLDPGWPAGIIECCRVSLTLRSILEVEGLTPVVKTSGQAGIHVYGVLPHRQPFAVTRAKARSIAADLSRSPAGGLVTTSRSHAGRVGKVMIDWSQNSPLRSMVAPYSVRAAAIPTVSTPLAWEEVEAAARLGTDDELVFSPRDVIDRALRLGDPFLPAAQAASGDPTRGKSAI